MLVLKNESSHNRFGLVKCARCNLVSKQIQIRARNIQTLLASVHLGNN